jgi:hypothetical protein
LVKWWFLFAEQARGKTRTVLAGSTPLVRVEVSCRGVLKDGKVVVRSKGRVLGKARITKGSKTTVPVNTKNLTPGKNRLHVQYLGNKTCLKSARTPLTVTVSAQ